jgi:hypothetical protein
MRSHSCRPATAHYVHPAGTDHLRRCHKLVDAARPRAASASSRKSGVLGRQRRARTTKGGPWCWPAPLKQRCHNRAALSSQPALHVSGRSCLRQNPATHALETRNASPRQNAGAHSQQCTRLPSQANPLRCVCLHLHSVFGSEGMHRLRRASEARRSPPRPASNCIRAASPARKLSACSAPPVPRLCIVVPPTKTRRRARKVRAAAGPQCAELRVSPLISVRSWSARCASSCAPMRRRRCRWRYAARARAARRRRRQPRPRRQLRPPSARRAGARRT